MNSSHPPRRSTLSCRWWRRALAAGVGLVACVGCVSPKYQRAPKDMPAPLALEFAAGLPEVAATLHTVIVQKGPGSWRKEAYWDEYVCSITNRGVVPLTVEAAAVVDLLGAEQSPGEDPWVLERRSRENIGKYEHRGRKIAIGAGLTLTWIATPGWAAAGIASGSAVGLWAGAATFVAIPVWAIGSGVRTLIARSAVADEFNRRRFALPLTLAPGETRRGSFFFPISPGPQRLILRHRTAEACQDVVIDLAPLAGLHLLKQVVSDVGSKP